MPNWHPLRRSEVDLGHPIGIRIGIGIEERSTLNL